MSVNDLTNSVDPLPYKHVIFTDLDGLDGVLVDLNSKKYYQLNETASFIWRGLEKQMPVDHIAAEMTQRYDVKLDHAISSIEIALRRFEAQDLLRPRNPG
ncbi:MAG TPA: PqqD family protein [Pyrinomonadaceae bacterium]|jgi:hypothetical protein